MSSLEGREEDGPRSSHRPEEEAFELELWGGATERRYRKARPEIEGMPWGSLDLSRYAPEVVRAARREWTGAAFQEHRTGAQCAATLRALFECKAPVDLVAAFSRFPLDELVHVELASRMAMELGGAVELVHTVEDMVREPKRSLSALLRAADLVVRTFCVGESLSIPLLHGAWLSTTHPLPRAVLGRIVRDEAAHGIVGWTFLDWAKPYVDDDGRAHLCEVANDAIGEVLKLWDIVRRRPKSPATEATGLGWMGDAPYLALAERSLATRVIRPLEERGYPVERASLPEGVLAALSSG